MAKTPRVKSKPKTKSLQWLDPDTALNFAYALHAAGDESIKGTPASELAVNQAQKFIGLDPPDLPGILYATRVQNVVLSHARGITRRKHAMMTEIASAKYQRDEMVERMKGARNNGIVANILFSKLGAMGVAMMLFAGIGYFLAQTIGPIVQQYLPTEAKSGRAPSFVLALIFAGFAKYASSTFDDFRKSRISSIYQTRHQIARMTYEKGKLDEYNLHRAELCRLWQEYTGKEYPDTPCYMLVLKADVAVQEMLERSYVQLSKSETVLLWERFLSLIPRRRKTVSSIGIGVPSNI